MPVGAVIFIHVYVLEQLRLKKNYAELTPSPFIWPVGITWGLTLALCLSMNLALGIEIFFLGLPGWFIAVIIYLVSSRVFQRHAISSAPVLEKEELFGTVSKN